MKLMVPDNVTWKNLQAGVVLLHLDTGAYFTLNETASLVWRKICEGVAEPAIVDAFVEEYDCTPEEAAADVRECVEYLRKETLLVDSAGA